MNSQIIEHLNLVIEKNKQINLTRIDSFDDGMLLHVEDSLSALPEFNNAPLGDYCDIGSGAGFPGIPIALETRRTTVLVESIGKKASCLEEFISTLGINDYCSVYNGRIESLALDYPERFSVVSARALAKTSVLLEFASPLLLSGGHLVCYKANVSKDEYDHALDVAQKVGMSLISDRSFYLSDNKTFRRILVFEKTHNSSIKLPRSNGYAQNKPL